MSLRRRETGRGELTDAMHHYLAVGCWQARGKPCIPPSTATREEKFDLFMLSAAVLRDDLAGLRRAWQDLGPSLKIAHPNETFAEMALTCGDWRKWPASFGRMACRQHPPSLGRHIRNREGDTDDAR